MQPTVYQSNILLVLFSTLLQGRHANGSSILLTLNTIATYIFYCEPNSIIYIKNLDTQTNNP